MNEFYIGDILTYGRVIIGVRSDGIVIEDQARGAILYNYFGNFDKHRHIFANEREIFCAECGEAKFTNKEKFPYVFLFGQLSENCSA